MTDFAKLLEEIPDEVLERVRFSIPWQEDSQTGTYVDPDNTQSYFSSTSRSDLQQECWSKFNKNPQVNTSVRGMAGRLTGDGFKVSCSDLSIQGIIDETELDWRNRLYSYWPKYVTKAFIDVELFLLLTVHSDKFIEVDYLDPSSIDGAGSDGIYFHRTKKLLPVAYNVQLGDNLGARVIPSIFVARDPNLLRNVEGNSLISEESLAESRSSQYGVNGFSRFIIAWDRGILVRRGISYLRTVIEWLNYYENLKKYEIDHKKASGSFVWAIEMQDMKTFRTWLTLSDEERRKTGIAAKKTPGATLILPPGMKLIAVTPNLPKISDSDTDILSMVVSGLNEPSDVTMGQSKSPYASVKASRGPLSDRVSDEVVYFERWLRYDFWGGIFFLKAKLGEIPETMSTKVAVGFDDKGKVIIKEVKKRPEQLLEISFPLSDIADIESKVKAFLGVKHGGLSEMLGIPRAEIAKRLGFNCYKTFRLDEALEQEIFPELSTGIDQESVQELETKDQETKEEPVAKKADETKPVAKKTIVKKTLNRK